MTPLYTDDAYTFRFAETRRIERIHLDGVGPGSVVTIYRQGPQGERLDLCASGRAGPNGWVALSHPWIVRAGDVFIAVPEINAPA